MRDYKPIYGGSFKNYNKDNKDSYKARADVHRSGDLENVDDHLLGKQPFYPARCTDKSPLIHSVIK
jgi:hypothetical protein